jgi:hypothetical protein
MTPPSGIQPFVKIMVALVRSITANDLRALLSIRGRIISPDYKGLAKPLCHCMYHQTIAWYRCVLDFLMTIP